MNRCHISSQSTLLSLFRPVVVAIGVALGCMPLRQSNELPRSHFQGKEKEKEKEARRKQDLSTLALHLLAVTRNIAKPTALRHEIPVLGPASFRRYRLPDRELSGLAMTGPQTSLFANSDRSFDVYRMTLKDGRILEGSQPEKIPFERNGSDSRKKSHWEAMAFGAADQALMLNETASTIECYKLRDNRASFLGFTRLIPYEQTAITGRNKATKMTEGQLNSGGEGLLLLNNGHLLVLKEKDPPAIMEYGPAGSSPQGYNKELRLNGRFACDGDSPLEPLHAWVFKNAQAFDDSFDLSEIALDTDGQLYLLSDTFRAIFQVGDMLGLNRPTSDQDTAEALSSLKVFDLPKAIDKPEGLAITSARSFFVLSDTDSKDDDNLFHLEF